MDVEQVRLLTTVKARDEVWDKGAIIGPPVPSVLIAELRNNTGTVEVVSVRTPQPPSQPEIPLEVSTEESEEETLSEDDASEKPVVRRGRG